VTGNLHSPSSTGTTTITEQNPESPLLRAVGLDTDVELQRFFCGKTYSHPLSQTSLECTIVPEYHALEGSVSGPSRCVHSDHRFSCLR
jgi:hypothetical protein